MGYKSKALSVREKKEVKKIAAQVLQTKAEKKWYQITARDLNLQTTVDTEPIPFHNGSLGVGESARIGNQIQVDKIRFHGSIEPDSNTVSVCRIMLVQWTGIDAVTLTATPRNPPLNGFVSPTGTIDNMHLFYMRKSDSDTALGYNYKIIYDQTFYFDAHAAGARKPWNLTIDGKSLMEKGLVSFSNTANNYENPLVLYGFGVDAVATLRYTAKVTYTDI